MSGEFHIFGLKFSWEQWTSQLHLHFLIHDSTQKLKIRIMALWYKQDFQVLLGALKTKMSVNDIHFILPVCCVILNSSFGFTAV